MLRSLIRFDQSIESFVSDGRGGGGGGGLLFEMASVRVDGGGVRVRVPFQLKVTVEPSKDDS